MGRVFRILKLIFLVVAILLCLAIPVSGAISTLVNWHGICYGFTDGQAPCPWWKFLGNEMFWASFLFIPFLFVAALAWVGMSLAQFIQMLVRKRRQGRQA